MAVVAYNARVGNTRICASLSFIYDYMFVKIMRSRSPNVLIKLNHPGGKNPADVAPAVRNRLTKFHATAHCCVLRGRICVSVCTPCNRCGSTAVQCKCMRLRESFGAHDGLGYTAR